MIEKTPLKLFNTLTRKKEIFKPIKKDRIGMYSCGPTVYWYQHIGNMRTAILADLVKRVLLFNGLRVDHVMNITDVDDKTIQASRREGVSLKELTQKYEKIYFEDLKKLNIMIPKITPRATENISGMINLISELLKKDYAYRTSDGVYFSIGKSNNYGRLAGLKKMKKTRERIRGDEYDKESARDFALWKFYSDEDGNLFWDAPFGKGRPGWHIECSAMSMKYLGETFDIHSGGADLTFPHHTNEIAQSEAATGRKFVNYWIHGALLSMKDGKMSKSLGNILTLNELEENYEPLAFRYLCLLTHYRKPLTFDWKGLDAAQNALERMKRKVSEIRKQKHHGNDLSNEYRERFLKAVNDDLNMPKALEVFWRTVDDFDFDPKKRLQLLKNFDSITGLSIDEMYDVEVELPPEIEKLVEARELLRQQKSWAEADALRNRILERGFTIEDKPDGPKIRKS